VSRTFDTIHAGGAFFESPRWHDGRWWVSDMWAGGVISLAPDGTDVVCELAGPAKPSGLGWRPDGTLLVVSMRDKLLLERGPGGGLQLVADLTETAGGPLCNELIVDPHGTAWVGSVSYDAAIPDTVVRVDTDGTAVAAARGFRHTNGMAITADGRTLIVNETLGARITAYTIGADGSLVDGRTWADLPGTGPDGCALDGRGRLWVADAFGHRCVLVAEGGAILEEVVPPGGLQAYACMLGGPEGRTLLMCCVPGWDTSQPADGTDAVLIVTEVDVPADARTLP
jgi:sugar lactone lactonase YvrE